MAGWSRSSGRARSSGNTACSDQDAARRPSFRTARARRWRSTLGSSRRGWRRWRRDRFLLFRLIDRHQSPNDEEDAEGVEDDAERVEVAAKYGVTTDEPDRDDDRAPEHALHAGFLVRGASNVANRRIAPSPRLA